MFPTHLVKTKYLQLKQNHTKPTIFTNLETSLSLMQFILQGVATIADMFSWQYWMHSVTCTEISIELFSKAVFRLGAQAQ